MKKQANIIIAGAGGIAEAVGLLLMEWSEVTPSLFIGNRTMANAQKVAEWIKCGTTKSGSIEAFQLSIDEPTEEMCAIFKQGDIILDCLPGSLAPKMAQFAKDF